MSDEDDLKEAGPEVQEAFARFVEVISTEDGRERFADDADRALGDEAAQNLPAELKGFLEALSVEELALLHRLSKRTMAAGLFSRQHGITMCHL